MQEIVFSFERLKVWQAARELSLSVYRMTEKFPSHEKFSLISQIRRSATSVAANLAEGSGRISAKDQARFTTIAFASLMELTSHLSIATGLNYLSEQEFQNLKPTIRDLSIKLSNLKTAQLSNTKTSLNNR